ncbi:MAG TPA: hypothetical protein DHV12_00445 [Thermotogae bacterium]|nr:hypothetical protein [Thermotogota bacterium]HCZ05604.1 hypothetical protein [Thermotogota bacterium]
MKFYTIDLLKQTERVESDSRNLEVVCRRMILSQDGDKLFLERPWVDIGAHDHYGEYARIVYVANPPLKITRWFGRRAVERDTLFYIDLCKILRWSTSEIRLLDIEVDFTVSRSGIIKLLDIDELVESYRDGRITLEDFSQTLIHLEELVNSFFEDLQGTLKRLMNPFWEMMVGFE